MRLARAVIAAIFAAGLTLGVIVAGGTNMYHHTRPAAGVVGTNMYHHT